MKGKTKHFKEGGHYEQDESDSDEEGQSDPYLSQMQGRNSVLVQSIVSTKRINGMVDSRDNNHTE